MASATSKPRLATGMKQRHHCVNALRTNTARVVRRDFGEDLARWYSEPVLRSRSHCAISVGGAPLEVLKRYIEQQDRPH